MPRLASAPVPTYRHPNMPQLHYGIVSVVAGVATIDLGIRHNNFIVTDARPKGALTAIATGLLIAWDYGTRRGTFVLTLAKQDAAFGPLILETVTRDISFAVLEGNAVSLY